MMREGQFFTSGAVREDGGALLVTRQCLLMISADVILSSMMSKASNGPSTVMVCLTLGTLPTPQLLPPPQPSSHCLLLDVVYKDFIVN